jgi:hypothetical protein
MSSYYDKKAILLRNMLQKEMIFRKIRRIISQDISNNYSSENKVEAKIGRFLKEMQYFSNPIL